MDDRDNEKRDSSNDGTAISFGWDFNQINGFVLFDGMVLQAIDYNKD